MTNMYLMKAKRMIGVLLSLVMVLSMIPAATAAAEAPEGNLVASYDMSLTDDKRALKDVSGNGYDAALSTKVTAGDFSDGAWTLNGLKEKYAKLPLGVITEEEFTIEVQAAVRGVTAQFLWVLGATEGTYPIPRNYLFLNPKNGEKNTRGKMMAAIKNDSGEVRFDTDNMPGLARDKYYNIVMTSEKGVLKLYVDGQLVNTLSHNYSDAMVDILAGNGIDTLGFIGRSVYTEDSGFAGKIRKFNIYDYTLSAEEVAQKHDESPVSVLEHLVIPGADDIRGNITLPEVYDGVEVTWEEVTDTGIVTLTSQENEDYDDTPAGVVTRQDEDTAVTLKASVKEGETVVSKEFNLTVKARPAEVTDEDYTGYLMAYFAGDGTTTEQVFFASSQDGMSWETLNNGFAIHNSTAGKFGTRDPYIARSPEGDKFYLIATDLTIAGINWDWGGAQDSGSQNIMVWESTDLVNWSEQRMVEISAGLDAGCTWAPEFFYDEMTGEYLIFWASKTAGDRYNQHRLYYVKTRDFQTFTEPEIMIERGQTTASVIDTTIVQHDGYYYRYSKNEGHSTIFLEKGTTLLGEFELLSQNIGIGGVEGPSVFKFNSKDSGGADKWCLLLDEYGSKNNQPAVRYYPTIMENLEDYQSYSKPETSEYSMPSPKACHGSVINLTTAEYEAVMDAYTLPVTYAATYVGEVPTTLPAAVSRTGKDGNEETIAVTWDNTLTGADFSELFDIVEVKGMAEGRPVYCYVEVVPHAPQYFIDCIADGETSSAYEAVAALAASSGSGLLNEVTDKAYTPSSKWGRSGTSAISSYGSSGLYDKYVSGHYFNDNSTGTTLTYTLDLEAGKYSLIAGLNTWWPGSARTLRATLTYGNTTDTIGTYTLNTTTPRRITDSNYTFTLDAPATVDFKLIATTNQAPTMSWLSVSEYLETEDIDLSASELEIGIGRRSTLQALFTPEFPSNSDVTWSTSDSTKVTVDDGVIRGVGFGEATITATASNNKSASCVVKVITDVSKINLSSKELNMEIGDEELLTGTVLPQDATHRSLAWETTDSSVAEVTDGLVTAKGTGSAFIRATAHNGKRVSTKVNVAVPVESVVLSADKISLSPGEQETLVSTILPDAANQTLTWTSSDSSVAEVTDGVIRAKKPGSAVITATAYNGISAQCTVTVKEISVPANLKLEGSGTNAVKLSWTKANNADGYEVWYATASNGTYSMAASTAQLTCTHTGLQAGGTYYYKVRAYKTVDGNKVYSAYTSAASISLTASVPAPTKVKTASAGATSIQVSWTKASGVNGYEIYRASSANGSYQSVGTVNSSKASFTNKNLTKGKTYYYKVRAYQTVNGTKVYSEYTKAVKRKAALAKPANVKVKKSGKTAAKISWKKAAGATKYEIYRSTSKKGKFKKVKTLNSKKKSFTNKKLAAGKTYYYKIKAVQKVGKKTYRSAFSARKSVKLK